MIKKLIFVLGVLCVFLPFHAQAATDTVSDQADLFSAEEKQQLSQQADELNKQIKGEVYVVTTYDNSEEPKEFANDYLRDKVGNNNNGAVLLLDMGQRQIYLSTSGNMIDYITDKRRDALLDTVQAQMADGNYYQAAESFLTDAAQYVSDGVPGGHYRIDEKTGKITRYKAITPLEIGISLFVAALVAIAFFVITSARYQLKRSTYTYPYREKASLDLASKEDRLARSFVTTRIIPKVKNDNDFGGGGSTTNSSGGGTFGGGGRGF